MFDPMELKERILKHLLHVRDTLLTMEYQELLDRMPKERQHEICLMVSRAQITCFKLQNIVDAWLPDALESNEPELWPLLHEMDPAKRDKQGFEQFTNNTALLLDLLGKMLENPTRKD
jgi:hypothetical protein